MGFSWRETSFSEIVDAGRKDPGFSKFEFISAKGEAEDKKLFSSAPGDESRKTSVSEKTLLVTGLLASKNLQFLLMYLKQRFSNQSYQF